MNKALRLLLFLAALVSASPAFAQTATPTATPTFHVVQYFVNTNSSAGGDCSTNGTAGATRACASLNAVEAAKRQNLTTNNVAIQILCDGTAADTLATTFSNTNWPGTDSTHTITIKANTASLPASTYSTSIYRYEPAAGQSNGLLFDGIYGTVTQLQLGDTSSGTAVVYFYSADSLTRTYTLTNCLIRGTEGSPSREGVKIYGDTGSANKTVIVANNVFYGVKDGINADAGQAYSVILYNNTCVGPSGQCIGIADDNATSSDTWYIKNNLMSGAGISCYGTSTSHATINTATNFTSDNTSPNIFGAGKVFTFTNAGANNYSLSTSDTSGALNGGTDLHADGQYAFSTDILGTSRPNGGWDAQAFQNTAATPTPTPTSALPIKPGIQGFGTHTTAGSGRNLPTPAATIYHVSSLSDANTSGTLRFCALQTGPRTCVFDVSGEIKTATNIQVVQPYLSIWGSSSPWPGIEIRGGQIQVGTHDVLIENIHSRAGDDLWAPAPTSRACMTMVADLTGSVSNVVIDHCTLGWSLDSCMNTFSNNTTGVHDISWLYNLVEEPLYNSFRGGGPQSTGALIDRLATNMTYAYNAFVHAFSRVPLSKAGTVVEFIGNLIYGWGFGQNGHPDGGFYQCDLSDYDHTGEVSKWIVIGNNYIPDLGSNRFEACYSSVSPDNFPTGSKIYVHDNLDPVRDYSTKADGLSLGNVLPTYAATAAPFTGVVTPVPQPTAKAVVLGGAGAFAGARDSVDTRVMNDVLNRTGTFKNCVTDDSSARCIGVHAAGGWPTEYGSARNRPWPEPTNPMGIEPTSGYTNLELSLFDYALRAQGALPTITPSPTPTGPTPSPTPTWTPLATWTASPTPAQTNTPIPTVSGGYGPFTPNPTWTPQPGRNLALMGVG